MSVSFQADPNNLIYATWAKGFRVGGANPPVPVDACHVSLDQFGLTGAPTGYDSDKVASRSEEHTSELQSLMRISYAVFSLKKKNNKTTYKHQYVNHTK